MAMKLTTEALKQILTQVITAALDEDGVFVGCNIGLLTNTNELGDNPVYGDFDQPAFTGYAVSADVVLGVPFLDDSGAYHVGTDLKQFQCSGGTPDVQITGAFLYKGAPASEKVMAYELFDDPININHVGDGLRYAATIKLPPDGDYGSGLLVA